MDELLSRIPKAGTTAKRKIFFDEVCKTLASLRKRAGANISVAEHRGKGTLISTQDDRGRQGGAGITGACCTDGECTITTRAACEAGGGNYLGDGSTCDGVDCTQGACCAPDGTCTITTQEDCSDDYQGDGTVCDPNPCPQPGACCFIDGTCMSLTESDCNAAGGAFQGAGTLCDDIDCTHTGACCIDGVCHISRREDCSGIYQGDNTPCDPNPCGHGPEPCPDCPPCVFVHDGTCYRAKTVNVSGTGSCGTCDGSFDITSALTCSGDTVSGVFSGTGHQDPSGDFTWVEDPGNPGHGYYEEALTSDPLLPIRCFEFSDAECACAGGIENCTDSCSGDATSGSCTANWEITVTYSDPCPSAMMPPP